MLPRNPSSTGLKRQAETEADAAPAPKKNRVAKKEEEEGPTTAFGIFANERRRQIRATSPKGGPELDAKKVTEEIRAEWTAMDEEAKEAYEVQATAIKEKAASPSTMTESKIRNIWQCFKQVKSAEVDEELNGPTPSRKEIDTLFINKWYNLSEEQKMEYCAMALSDVERYVTKDGKLIPYINGVMMYAKYLHANCSEPLMFHDVDARWNAMDEDAQKPFIEAAKKAEEAYYGYMAKLGLGPGANKAPAE